LDEEEKAIFSGYFFYFRRSTVIASQRVGAKRRPMINSAKQSMGNKEGRKNGLLRRFASRNDEKANLRVSVSQCDALCFVCGHGLSSGTVTERIAPESLTPSQCGFVHRNISRRVPFEGTRSGFAGCGKRADNGEFLKIEENMESNQK
jgi:hypothetical protein